MARFFLICLTIFINFRFVNAQTAINENEQPIRPKPVPTIEPDSKNKDCRRKECPVWAYINLTTQRMTLYVDGIQKEKWKISSGDIGWETPQMETHPDGRLYTAYDSQDYPGGFQYKNLGNMPYSVFVRGGIAIHGTPEEYWDNLGTPDSHGCIRLHPTNAKVFLELVKKTGVKKVWISIVGEWKG